MTPPKTYRVFCEKAENNPHSSEEDRKDLAQLATAHFDTITTNSKNKDQLLVEVLMDVGPASGMNGGLITFMEKPDELGGILQFLHNISVHTSKDHYNVPFAYFDDVEDGEVESVLFQKSLLTEADEVIVLDTMERLEMEFANDKNLGLVGTYTDATPFTKKITMRECIFLPFALVPHVIGQNLTPREAVQVLVPVMAALNLKLSQLTQFILATCTKATDNHPPVTVQDQMESGLIHTRNRMNKVVNAWWNNILHQQLLALSPTSSNLGNSVAAIQNITISTKGLRFAFDRNTNQRCLDVDERKKPTSVGEGYPHQRGHILKACAVDKEKDLPIIWGQMANCKRESEPLFTMFQMQVSMKATHFG